MKKTKSRILASFVAVMLCFTAFSTVLLPTGTTRRQSRKPRPAPNRPRKRRPLPPAASKILRMQTKMPLIRQKPKP